MKGNSQAPEEDEPTLQLRDMPADELPREKLIRRGRASLSDEELIAIFLRTGLHGCNVLQLAAHLKRRAGSLAALGELDAADIQKLYKGIGPAKAATLAAVFELGRRAVQEQLSRRPINAAQDVYDLLAPQLRFEQQEHLYLLMLDIRRRLIRCQIISIGTLARVVVHPRNIFAPAVKLNAASIIIAHNHPSGSPRPSKQDIQLTEAIRKAGEVMFIPLLDHVIIGAPSADFPLPFYSFAEHKLPDT